MLLEKLYSEEMALAYGRLTSTIEKLGSLMGIEVAAV